MEEKNIKKTFSVKYQSLDSQGDFEFGNIESNYGATDRYFTQSGMPWIPLIGEFHFSRYDNCLWDMESAIKLRRTDPII